MHRVRSVRFSVDVNSFMRQEIRENPSGTVGAKAQREILKIETRRSSNIKIGNIFTSDHSCIYYHKSPTFWLSASFFTSMTPFRWNLRNISRNDVIIQISETERKSPNMQFGCSKKDCSTTTLRKEHRVLKGTYRSAEMNGIFCRQDWANIVKKRYTIWQEHYEKSGNISSKIIISQQKQAQLFSQLVGDIMISSQRQSATVRARGHILSKTQLETLRMLRQTK